MHALLSGPNGSVAAATWNHTGWRTLAACRNLDTEIFFPVGVGDEALEQTALARTICAACPAREACLEFAIRTLQDHGIWGGHTEDERRVIRRRRRAAARRRAVAVAAGAATLDVA